MNINKPNQIFAHFKDVLNSRAKSLQGVHKDKQYYADPKASHALKVQLENTNIGLDILNRKEVHHFLMPDDGVLMDDHLINKPFNEIINRFLVDQKLPFPKICIEFETPTKEKKEVVSNLNTLIMVEYFNLTDEAEPYLKINSIHEIQHEGKDPFVMAIPESFILDLNIERINSRDGICTYYIDENGDLKILNQDIHNAYSTISKVLGLLVALSCKNIRSERTAPPPLNKNQKRQKQGLTVHRAYNFIVIDTAFKSKDVQSLSTGSGKATHVRRGHIRHYENKNIWIEQTVINANADEVITKSYKVK